MQYYYGDRNILRALDEADFWTHQEAEHTEVILALTPGLDEKYVAALNEFRDIFFTAQGEAVKNIQTVIRSRGDYERFTPEMVAFIGQCLAHTQAFIGLLEQLLRGCTAVKKNQAAQTVIRHIIRESQYFIGIDKLMLSF